MRNDSPTIDWNDETTAKLREFWGQEVPAAEIGRRLGASKNAIVGKARRIGLKSRPSPIRRDGIASSRSPGRPPPPTLAEIVPVISVAPAEPPTPAVAPSARVMTASPAPKVAAVTAWSGRDTCCWPIGEPGHAGFRFCDAPAPLGKPYCDDHAERAYQRRRPPGEAKSASSA